MTRIFMLISSNYLGNDSTSSRFNLLYKLKAK